MIECVSCRQVLDIDDDTAYDLGWRYESIYYDETNFEDMWWCPHCTYAEID